MKIAIIILAGLLLVLVLLTTLQTILYMDLPKLFDDKIDPDEKYMALAIPMGLIIYAYAVFLEVELFFGVISLLLGIKYRKVLRIIMSGFVILPVLTSTVLIVWMERFHDTLPNILDRFSLAIIIAAIITIIVSDIALISISIVSKIKNISRKKLINSIENA